MASAQDKASASANAHASASGLLSVPVLLPMRVPGTCCHRVRDFGTAYIRALVEFQVPVCGTAYAGLGHRPRVPGERSMPLTRTGGAQLE